jgi:hypothetical protein
LLQHWWCWSAAVSQVRTAGAIAHAIDAKTGVSVAKSGVKNVASGGKRDTSAGMLRRRCASSGGRHVAASRG